jgi:hypothetical protein
MDGRELLVYAIGNRADTTWATPYSMNSLVWKVNLDKQNALSSVQYNMNSGIDLLSLKYIYLRPFHSLRGGSLKALWVEALRLYCVLWGPVPLSAMEMNLVNLNKKEIKPWVVMKVHRNIALTNALIIPTANAMFVLLTVVLSAR